MDKKRREQILKAQKYLSKEGSNPNFEQGAKWADNHPYWKTDIPKYSENDNGLPKLYLCQIITLDMTFGYRYSYRVGFINDKGFWNINNSNTKVVRYMGINCAENYEQLIEDIKQVKFGDVIIN